MDVSLGLHVLQHVSFIEDGVMTVELAEQHSVGRTTDCHTVPGNNNNININNNNNNNSNTGEFKEQ